MSKPLISANDLIKTAENELNCTITANHRKALEEILAYQSAPIDNEHALRYQLDEWFQKRTFKQRKIKFLDFDLELHPFIVFELISQTLSEERTIVPQEEPYIAQVLDTDAPLEELWQQAPYPTFASEERGWTRDGSSEIIGCRKCRETGIRRCNACNGTGEVDRRCASCGGRGHTTSTDHGTHSHTKDDCSNCNGSGEVTERCSRCRGGGEVTCHTCKGHKKLHVYEDISSKSSITEQTKLISVYPDVANNVQIADIDHNMLLTHTAYFDLNSPTDLSCREIGNQYKIRIYKANKVCFFYEKEREIFLIDDKIIALDIDYLVSKRKVTLVVILVVVILVILVVLLTGAG